MRSTLDELSSSLVAVATWVRRLRADKHAKPLKLYEESRYEDFHGEISVDSLAAVIRKDPALIREWERFSEDQRCSPAWYFSSERGGFVGHEPRDSKKKARAFDDPAKACAYFVKMEMEGLRRLFAANANKPPEPTSGTVTPRAEPRVAPVPPVAHL